MRNENYHHNPHDKRLAIVLAIAGLIVLGGYWKYKSNNITSTLNNPLTISEQRIEPSDTYWNYARNMKENCEKLEEIPRASIIEKLENLNGERLLAGDRIKIPQYCEGEKTANNE